MKRAVILILISLFLIGFVASAGMTASAIENSCTDSDNGKDYSKKGTTTKDSDTKTDECAYCTGLCPDTESECASSCGAVLEFYCESNEIKNETHVCEDDETCNNGRCISKEDDSEENGQHQNTQNQGEDSQIQTRNRLTSDEVKNIIAERNRIRNEYQNQSECPHNCTCTGSATKCRFENGTREMTILAGKSGNIIVQVKGINVSTTVTLYKSEDKIYAVFKNNETREVKVFPDEIRERLRERIKAKLEYQNLELAEEGHYEIQAQKRARLFAIFPIRATVRAEIDAETGEVLRVRRPWWNFLAKDETE